MTRQLPILLSDRCVCVADETEESAMCEMSFIFCQCQKLMTWRGMFLCPGVWSPSPLIPVGLLLSYLGK